MLGENLESKFVRVEANDPNRCQATHADYQCPYRAVGTFDSNKQEWEGSKYCPRHGANKHRDKEDADSLRMYNTAKWQAHIARFAGNVQIKSLRQEIGILRMVLETKLNKCSDETELLMNASGISEMATKLSDLIKTCHKIEKDSNQLLDRSQAQSWVNQIIAIIAMYVSDPDVLQAMSEDMMAELDKMLNSSR